MVFPKAPNPKRMYPGNSGPRGRRNFVPTSIDSGGYGADYASNLRRIRMQLTDISVKLQKLEISVISEGGRRPKSRPPKAQAAPRSTPQGGTPAGTRPGPRYTSIPTSPVQFSSVGTTGGRPTGRPPRQGTNRKQSPCRKRADGGQAPPRPACAARGPPPLQQGAGRGRPAPTVPPSGQKTLRGFDAATITPGTGGVPGAKPCSAPNGAASPPPCKRRWARQLLIPVADNSDAVIKKLLGPGGSHVRLAAERHCAKLRVRGIGSGHAEGRMRKEAQVPLHLCVSAATQRGLEGALAEARILIARATGTTAGRTAKRTTVRLALVNGGKPSDASSFELCGWAHANEVDACLVSEGALYGRSLVTDHGFAWEAPLKQTKGGAGFLISRKAATTGGKVRLVQCPKHCWSLASWWTAGGTGLIVAYINPQDVRDREILTSFLARLTSLLEGCSRWVIGGDFNAPSGSAQRRVIDNWCEENGLALANPGVLTHFAGPEHQGSDLDLILVRNATVRVLPAHEPPQRGHVRQVLEVVEEQLPRRAVAPPPYAWKRLSCTKVQGKFIAAAKAAMNTAPNLDAALEQAAAATLGRVPGPAQASRSLPPAVRRELRELRQAARAHPRGSPEHQDVSREIGRLMRRHRQAQWKSTLARLASGQVVEDDTWRLLRFLQKPSPTTRMVGIPDREIRDAFSAIYQSNRTRRLDWVFSATQGSAPVPEGRFPELDAPFTSAEVIEALSTLPNRKAPGLDGLPHEAYRVLRRDPGVVAQIAAEATALLAGAAVPPLEGRLVTIPKKGAAERAADMRPLMMLPTSRKVVEKLVAGRLDRLAEMRGWDGLCPLQGGFRHGMGVDRQLVLAQVAVVDAQRRGQQRRFVGLDLVKAFDRIPKEFAAHCAAGYLGPLCPKLARLVARLALAPFEARVGSHSFAVSTGVPQGGILSPWLFVMAMNDLALRLGGAGGAVVGTQELGTLLYADDILLVDDSVDSSESRCRLTKEWVEEWGGAIHPAKTQWLDINVATSSPTPGVQEGANPGGSIDFLGVTLTPTGVRPKVGPEVFANMLSAVRSTMEVRGLAPAPALQCLRSVAWAKLAHGAVVTLPCAANLTTKWLGAARQVLCTFKRVHRAEVIRELGLLYHPVTWLCRAVIRFYGTALTTARDPVLKRVLTEALGAPDHPLRRRVEAVLAPSGVTWEELATVPVPDLIRKADGRLREWSREQLLGEAARLELHRGDAAPLWREWSDGPRKYLYEVNARYGFMFRRGSFAPPDIETAACYFCGRPGGDWGRHLLHCEVARAAIPLERELQALPPQSLEQALLLEDATPVQRLRAVLAYMQLLYQARQRRRDRAPQRDVKRDCPSNPAFFKFRGPPAAARPPTPRRRATRRTRSSLGEEAGDGLAPKRRRIPPPTTPPLPTSPLSAGDVEQEEEHVPSDILLLLDEPCHEMVLSPRAFPVTDGDRPIVGLIKRARERAATVSSAAKRPRLTLAETGEASSPPAGGPAPPSPTQREGPWTAEEIDRLARAALQYGVSSAARLAPHVPTRGVRQIRMRLRTADFSRSVDRIRAAQGGSTQQAASEPPATVPTGAPEPPPLEPQTSDPALPRTTSPAPPAEKQFSRGRWTGRETALLHAAIKAHDGAVTGEILSQAVGTRSPLQCLDRMREKATKEFVASLALPPPEGSASATTSGRWTALEIRRLEGAVNQLGNCLQYAELAAILGDRTWFQVSTKINDLLRAGKLKQTGPASFAISR